MTNTPSLSSAARAIFAGAATIATLGLFSVAQSGTAEAAAAPSAPQVAQIAVSTTAGRVITVNDDDNFNPSSGDIFTQNAQDQSTASGAGT